MQSIFVTAEERNIKACKELKPFWRQFCLDTRGDKAHKSRVQFIATLKEKCMKEFGVSTDEAKKDPKKQDKINWLHGGISQDQDQREEDVARRITL